MKGNKSFGIGVGSASTNMGAGSSAKNTGTINISGEDSGGIAVQVDMTGGIENTGTINISGKNSFGMYSEISRELNNDGTINITDGNNNIGLRTGNAAASLVNKKDINIYINSPGGSVTAGMAIYDTMQFIKPDVRTLCIGQACSMGAFLLAGGTAGKRAALPNARVMIHQPLGGFRGQASDIQIHAQEILKIKQTLNERLAFHTGQSIERIEKDTDRDNFMSAEEAKAYGLVDDVLIKR